MQTQNNTEPTNRELMEAIRGLSASNKDLMKGFQDLSATMNDFVTDTENRLGNLEKDMKEVKRDIVEVKQDVRGVKSSMVTKSYLDDKLSDRLGDVKSMVRQEDNKVNCLAETLVDEGALKENDKSKIVSMGPFVQPSI